MIGLFSKLTKVKSKEEKELEKLQLKAKPYFDFINFLKVYGVKFYQDLDIDGTMMKFQIDPTMDQINEWVVKYFEAEKYIRENKDN